MPSETELYTTLAQNLRIADAAPYPQMTQEYENADIISPVDCYAPAPLKRRPNPLLRDFGGRTTSGSVKGPGDFVSAADKRAEQILFQELSVHAQISHSWMESAPHGPKMPNVNSDPLDGTTNFLHGLPHSAITVSVLRNKGRNRGRDADPVKTICSMRKKARGRL